MIKWIYLIWCTQVSRKASKLLAGNCECQLIPDKPIWWCYESIMRCDYDKNCVVLSTELTLPIRIVDDLYLIRSSGSYRHQQRNSYLWFKRFSKMCCNMTSVSFTIPLRRYSVSLAFVDVIRDVNDHHQDYCCKRPCSSHGCESSIGINNAKNLNTLLSLLIACLCRSVSMLMVTLAAAVLDAGRNWGVRMDDADGHDTQMNAWWQRWKTRSEYLTWVRHNDTHHGQPTTIRSSVQRWHTNVWLAKAWTKKMFLPIRRVRRINLIIEPNNFYFYYTIPLFHHSNGWCSLSSAVSSDYRCHLQCRSGLGNFNPHNW